MAKEATRPVEDGFKQTTFTRRKIVSKFGKPFSLSPRDTHQEPTATIDDVEVTRRTTLKAGAVGAIGLITGLTPERVSTDTPIIVDTTKGTRGFYSERNANMTAPDDSSGPDIEVPASYHDVPRFFVAVPGVPDVWVGDNTPEVHAAISRKLERYRGLENLPYEKTWGVKNFMAVVRGRDARGEDRFWPMYDWDKVAAGPGQGGFIQETLVMRNLVRAISGGGFQLDVADGVRFTPQAAHIELLKNKPIIGEDGSDNAPTFYNMYKKGLIFIEPPHERAENKTGQKIQLDTLNQQAETGKITPSLPPVTVLRFDEATGHNYITEIENRLFEQFGPSSTPLFGLPLSEAFEIDVKIKGVPTRVYMQVRQRAIVTLNLSESNPDWQLQASLAGNLVKTALIGNNPVPYYESQRSGSNATYPEWARSTNRFTGQVGYTDGSITHRAWAPTDIGRQGNFISRDPDFPGKALIYTNVLSTDPENRLLIVDSGNGQKKSIIVAPQVITRMELTETYPGPWIEDKYRFGANAWDFKPQDKVMIVGNSQADLAGSTVNPLGLHFYS